jgi:hypothetical protein
MSSVPLRHPGDAFVCIYDALDALRISTRELRAWAEDPDVRLLANSVREEVLDAGGVLESRLEGRSARELYAVLRGIDEAFWYANPFREYVEHGELGDVRETLIRTHKYNDSEAGALLPRRTYPGTPMSGPSELAQHFDLVRVPEQVWKQVSPHTLMDSLSDFEATTALTVDLKVGQLPFLANSGDLRVKSRSEGSYQYYQAWPRPGRDWSQRIEDALASADMSGAHLVLLPELALDSDLLHIWQETIRSHRPRETVLRWILLGSGPTISGDADGHQPANRAALVDRSNGDIILAQDKQCPFNISDRTLRRWNLHSYRSWDLESGKGTYDEWIAEGTALAFLESEIGRFVILVCEDLGHVPDIGYLVRSIGASQVLVPIWAPPINRYHWEEQSGGMLVNHIGCTTIVSNGLSLGRKYPASHREAPGEPAVTLLVLAALEETQAVSAPSNVTRAANAVLDATTTRVADWLAPPSSAPHLRRGPRAVAG